MSTSTPKSSLATEWTGECEPVDDDSRMIRQGDVFQWEDRSTPWRQYGVVVTGDCDIVQDKNAGIVSYVPVLPLHEYWRVITVPKKIERYARDKFLPRVRDCIRSLQRKYCADYPIALSDDAISALVSSSSGDRVMEVLSVPLGGRAAPLRAVQAFGAFLNFESLQTLQQLVALLAELRGVVGATSANASKILEELSESVGELPGDALFLSTVAPGVNEGYVAYLRMVRELNATSLAFVPKDLQRPSVVARRLAKLRSPYIYRLTQQLAQVFSDIGLPHEYEKNRDTLASVVKERWRSGPAKQGKQ